MTLVLLAALFTSTAQVEGLAIQGNTLWTAIRHFTTNLRQDGKPADDPSVADRRDST